MRKLLCALMLVSAPIFAAGRVSQQFSKLGNTNVWVNVFTWTADASDGSVPSTPMQSSDLQKIQGFRFVGAEFSPGSPAPTSSYAVTFRSQNGGDLLGGNGASLSATLASSAAAGSSAQPLNGTATFALTGNVVNSATGRVAVYFQDPSDPVPISVTGGGSGNITSVFGRTGVVVSANGDYTASQVTNVPAGNISAVTVQAAIAELDAEKQALGNYITSLTGDITASGPGAAAATLATVNSNVGACGDSTHVCQSTYDAKGRVTAATAVAIAASGGTVTVVGAGTLTSTRLATGGGSQTIQTPSSAGTMDSSGNISALSITTGDATKSGSTYLQGLTSGGAAWAVADVAGTAIVYVMPSTNGAAGQVLTDTGSTTCPTLPAGLPATCHLLAWQFGALAPLTSGTSISLTGNSRFFVCTSTCTVTPPVPSAGVQYCVMNGDNVSTVITLAALGSSASYENQARTAYGTAGTGTLVSSGAVADMVCIVGLDSTHYLTVSAHGTLVAN